MATKYSETVQRGGEIALPMEWLQKYAVQAGDMLEVEELPDGRLIVSTRTAGALKTLDEIGLGLADKGISLEQMIDDGRAIRATLLKELYGIDAPDSNA